MLPLWGSVIDPFAVVKTDGQVSDMVYRSGKLYVSTDTGVVNVFDVKTRKKIGTLKVQPTENQIPFKAFSADHYDGKTAVVIDSGKDFREVYLISREGSRKIVDYSKGLLIKKLRFADADHLVLGLSSDMIVMMDLRSNTLLYQIQAGGGVFRDMALSRRGTLIAVADEGGEITMIDLNKGKKIKTLRGINVDNINRIDYKNNTIISAGQDRRVGVYRQNGSYYLDSDFFIYAVGLSPSARLGVYTDGTENDLQVFTLADKTKTVRLRGGEVLFDTLIFADEHLLIGAGEDDKIYFWRIP